MDIHEEYSKRLRTAEEAVRLVQDGDLVAITAGVPLGVSGTTNLMKVEKIGK